MEAKLCLAGYSGERSPGALHALLEQSAVVDKGELKIVDWQRGGSRGMPLPAVMDSRHAFQLLHQATVCEAAEVVYACFRPGDSKLELHTVRFSDEAREQYLATIRSVLEVASHLSTLSSQEQQVLLGQQAPLHQRHDTLTWQAIRHTGKLVTCAPTAAMNICTQFRSSAASQADRVGWRLRAGSTPATSLALIVAAYCCSLHAGHVRGASMAALCGKCGIDLPPPRELTEAFGPYWSRDLMAAVGDEQLQAHLDMCKLGVLNGGKPIYKWDANGEVWVTKLVPAAPLSEEQARYLYDASAPHSDHAVCVCVCV